MILRLFAGIVTSVRASMLAQKCRPRLSEFGAKFTFLLEQEIKLILTLISMGGHYASPL